MNSIVGSILEEVCLSRIFRFTVAIAMVTGGISTRVPLGVTSKAVSTSSRPAKQHFQQQRQTKINFSKTKILKNYISIGYSRSSMPGGRFVRRPGRIGTLSGVGVGAGVANGVGAFNNGMGCGCTLEKSCTWGREMLATTPTLSRSSSCCLVDFTGCGMTMLRESIEDFCLTTPALTIQSMYRPTETKTLGAWSPNRHWSRPRAVRPTNSHRPSSRWQINGPPPSRCV